MSGISQARRERKQHDLERNFVRIAHRPALPPPQSTAGAPSYCPGSRESLFAFSGKTVAPSITNWMEALNLRTCATALSTSPKGIGAGPIFSRCEWNERGIARLTNTKLQPTGREGRMRREETPRQS